MSDSTTGPRPQVGMGVLVMRGQKVLLGRRQGSHGAGTYSAPGGHIEFGESFVQTARREVAEETGLEIENVRLLSIGSYIFENGRHYIDIDVVCQAPHGDPCTPEPEKCAGWAWYDLDALPQPLFIVTEQMLHSYLHGSLIAGDLDTVLRVG